MSKRIEPALPPEVMVERRTGLGAPADVFSGHATLVDVDGERLTVEAIDAFGGTVRITVIHPRKADQ